MSRNHIYVGRGGSHIPLIKGPEMSEEALRALLCAAVEAYEDAQQWAASSVWYSMQLYGRPDGNVSHADIRARELTGQQWAADAIWLSITERGRPDEMDAEAGFIRKSLGFNR